tara:strand:+ start:2266 stop:2439 length:174 start_codon:yes stop_codon:yes gene_type:complete
MTDLSKVLEAVKNSKVVLDQEFWDKQNEQIHKNQKRFVQQARDLTPTDEDMNRRFNV